MEVLSEGKNFRLLHEDELPEVLRILGDYLPESIKFHETLKTFMNDRVWDFHFYVCKSWPEQLVILHFPGMTKTPHGLLYESFSVFCPQRHLDTDFNLLLAEDLLINWSRPIYLNFTHVAIVGRLEEHYSGVLGGTMDKLCGDVYSMGDHVGEIEAEDGDKEVVEGATVVCGEGGFVGDDDGVKVNGVNGHVVNGEGKEEEFDGGVLEDGTTEITLHERAEMLQLGPEHAPTIYALYPAREMECLEIFKRLIARLPCYGIFTDDGTLVAWMVQSYYGAMFSMQTRPEYRRRGYGQRLARALTHEVARRGYQPFVVIRPENDASLCLYQKLGFRKNYETVRAILRPSGEAATGEGVAGGGGGGGDEEEGEVEGVLDSAV